MSTLYQDDFYSWSLAQAAGLRRLAGLRLNHAPELDWRELAEEIEDLRRSLERELHSRLVVLLLHLLKWQFQPTRRSNSWMGTIRRERIAIAKHLRDNPGLKPRRVELLSDSYDEAVQGAVAETNLPLRHFPEHCPYALDEVMDAEFWPSGVDLPQRQPRRRR